jgi:hypothetical protein
VPAPSIPQNLIAQQGNGQVYLSWDQVAGATSYPLQRSTDNVNFTAISPAPTTPQYLDTNVIVGTTYYYKVASDNGTTSSYTNSVSVVPALTGQMSLGQVRLLAQQRADRVNSNFVTKEEWNSYINQSYTELYDLLVTLYEDYYVAAPLTFITDGSTNQYTLPNGSNFNGAPAFYKLLGADCGLGANGNAWVTLHKFDFISRNRYVFPNVTSTFLGVFNLRYRVVGNTLFFIPTPSANQYIRLWYIPRVNTLLKDSDMLDSVSGWIEYVIVDAAIKCLQKEESDVTILMAQKQMLIDRIQSSAMNRDAGQPDTISDVRTFGERWGGYGSPNGDGSFGGY